MLKLDNIKVEQGDFHMSMNVAFGKPITALIGPSGAGKSTVLNVIAGFLTPVSGKVVFNDQDITSLKPAMRPVSILFQDHNLFPHLSVLENIALGLTPKRPSAEQKSKCSDALSRVDLKGYENRQPGTLSGGEQSRVALARILLQNRPIMLLDEPFSALGPAMRKEMLELVALVSDQENMQVIMVSHDPNDAIQIANQCAVVAENEVSTPEKTSHIMKNPPKLLKEYLG